jgi:hypothetical protein
VKRRCCLSSSCPSPSRPFPSGVQTLARFECAAGYDPDGERVFAIEERRLSSRLEVARVFPHPARGTSHEGLTQAHGRCPSRPRNAGQIRTRSTLVAVAHEALRTPDLLAGRR